MNKISLLALFSLLTPLAGCIDSSDREPLVADDRLFVITGLSESINENEPFSNSLAIIGESPVGEISWSLSGDDSAQFQISSGGELQFTNDTITATARDFESAADTDSDNVYEATVVATDSDGNVASAALALSVLNLPTISGTVAGLDADSVTLTVNGVDTLQVSADGEFEFSGEVLPTPDIAVAITSQPSDTICELVNSTTVAPSNDIDDLAVFCVARSVCPALLPISSSDPADLSGNNIAGIESLVQEIECPTESWRAAANLRIDNNRKLQRTIEVIDPDGFAVPSANIDLQLLSHEFKFGAAAQAKLWHGTAGFDGDPSSAAYQQAYLGFGFNKGGFQNALKYKLRESFASFVQPMLNWFSANDIDVRGHALIWPAWENMEAAISAADLALITSYDSAFTETVADVAPQDLSIDNLKIYINYMIASQAAQWDVVEWDVLNEPRDKTDVSDKLGVAPNAIEEANWFNLAEASVLNIDALLFLNENKVISDDNTTTVITNRVNSFRATADSILANGGALQALGFQSRFGAMNSADDIYARLEYFSDMGLPIAATEFEMKDDKITDEFDRAVMTERVMTTYFSHSAVTDIMAFTFMQDQGRTDARHLVNLAGEPNLRGKIWLYLTKKYWTTHVVSQLDRNGQHVLDGFKGNYRATVSRAGELDQIIDFTFEEGVGNIVIQLNSSDPFTITGIASTSINENTAYTGATPSFDDPLSIVNLPLDWSKSGADAALFTLSSTGVLSMGAKDFESTQDANSNNSYEVTLTATEQGGNTASASIEVTINDIVSEPFSPPAISTTAGAPVSSAISAGGLTFIRPPSNNELTCGGSTIDAFTGLRYCNISHADALAYCAGLEGGYRMPSEAELQANLLPLFSDDTIRTTHQWPTDKSYWSITPGTIADRVRVLRYTPSIGLINWNPTSSLRAVCVRP